MRVTSIATMRKIEQNAIEVLGIPSIVLMENAAHKVIKNIKIESSKNFVIICGSGNNGGDGLAIARNLKISGKNIEVFLNQNGKNLSEDCRTNYNILKNLGIRINPLNNIEDFEALRDALISSDITIDALFGSGINRELNKFYVDAISLINENSKYVVSVDIPSGMDGDTGKIMGNCIRAQKTITFQMYKKGFLAYETIKYTGKIIVENIGIPKELISKFHENIDITEIKDVKRVLPERDTYAYKGDFGKVLIIAGNDGFTGAAYITCEAAVKSGAGLVTLATKKSIKDILCTKLAEAMTIDYDDTKNILIQIKKSDVIAIGPGMGDNQKTLEILKLVINNSNSPIVIDADGINVIAKNKQLLKNVKVPIVITPHLGEMARLCEKDIDYVRNNRFDVAIEISKKFNITVLLKGYNTIITNGNKTFINPTGNSAMASGGMGDCLTGIIAALIGEGCDAITGARIGAFIHGYAGENLSKELFSVNATKIIEKLPNIIKEIQEI